MSEGFRSRASLSGEHYEVVVIGGGINGAAIARECALAGKRVLLLEQTDFAAGTTSRATRIIHGGLRYLEHGELGLVRESLRERQRLLLQSGHLVHPLNFVLAMPRHGGVRRSALAVRAGLWLYRKLAHSQKPPQVLGDELNAALDRGLDLRFFSYTDAQCEYPERLTIEWIGDAMAAGAAARNYSKALAIQVRDGRACGVRFRDDLTSAEDTVSCDWVVNASGPWVDRVNRQSGLSLGRLIGGVRGSHLIFSKLPPGLARLADRGTALYAEAIDGRPLFAIPWSGQLLFGTTEIADDDDPARTQPSGGEIAYLLQSINRLIGNGQITERDVHYAYAGVRPLPWSPGTSVSALSRSYFLHDHIEDGAARLISVVGGKLTTAGSLGRQCARKIGCPVAEPRLEVVGAQGANSMKAAMHSWAEAASRSSGLSAQQAIAIAEWYGAKAQKIVDLATVDPSFRRPIAPGSVHILAEAVYAVQTEGAIHLGDILLRRVPVALEADWDETCTGETAAGIGRVLGWNERQVRSEAESFELERSAFLRRVQPARATGEPAPISALQEKR